MSYMQVSIHARHCRRANRGFPIPLLATMNCFNPRPPLLAGEPLAMTGAHNAKMVSIHARHCWRANPAVIGSHLAVVLFQSTPAIAGGRTERHRDQASAPASFNPRPPLLAGEPHVGAEMHGVMDVSIHARHCWRANPAHIAQPRMP